MMLSRACVLVALLLTGLLASACIYDFDIPGSEPVSTDPSTTCAANTKCDYSCTGGSCKPTCGMNSSCTVGCTGGSCDTTCAAGATCEISCTGGSCNTDCQGKCTISCVGGSCKCTGPGCP